MMTIQVHDAAQRALDAVRRMRMEGKRSAPRELKAWVDEVLAEEEQRIAMEVGRLIQLASTGQA